MVLRNNFQTNFQKYGRSQPIYYLTNIPGELKPSEQPSKILVTGSNRGLCAKTPDWFCQDLPV